MKPTSRHLLSLFTLAVAVLGASPAEGLSLRTAGLRRAISDAGAVRNVYFVRGMNCRACTLILDRNLNEMDGVLWARFAYPARLLTIYLDPGQISASRVEEMINFSGKLNLVLLASGPARDYAAAEGVPVGAWKGGSLSLTEAREAPKRFLSMLEAYMIEPGTDDWHQVLFEISAEEMRNRIFLARAREEGYTPGAAGGELPVFISKDFHYPVELMPLTPEEAAVARYVRERVIEGDESEEGMKKFDSWLLALWKDLGLDFRGEILELSGQGR
jgi:hypothetical protein